MKNTFQRYGISGQNGYKTALNYCESIYNIRFTDLRLAHLQGILDNCGKDYPVKNLIRSLFNMLYKYAIKNDIVEKRYSQFLDLGKYKAKHKKTPFTEEEIQLLFDNVDRIKFVDTVLIMIFSGMRVSEMLSIETEKIKINTEERYIIGGSKTEAGRERVIPINKKILPYIKKYYNPENKYLITDEEGKPYTYGKYKKEIWSSIMEQLKINHNPHECRHTATTSLDREGVSKLVIKKILGHSTSDITDRYTHKNIQDLTDGIDKI